jgi:dihydrofolate synthase/folylpolyglutamate synthase
MGGRLDPTNIAQSVATAITVIELEHTDMLGTTIKQIAREKAGIIKENCPLVLAEQTHSAGSDALDIFIESARAKHAPLLYFPDTVELQNVTVTRDGTRWTLIDRTKTLFPAPLKLSIKLCGEIQAKNTSLAILAVRKAFPEIAERTIVEAVSRVRLPARFEKVLDDPPVIIDGAHTEISVRLCAQTFTSLYGPGGILLFGCAAGKDASAMAKHLIPHFSIIIITTPGTYKVSEPEKVFAIFKEVEAESREQRAESREGGAAKIEFVKDTQEGIARAISIAKEKKLPVLGAGSFYLAAEIRNRVANMLLL